MAKTRPIPERDSTVRSGKEILRRIVFVFYVLCGIGGSIALLVGIPRHDHHLAVAGAVSLAVSLALHIARRLWRAVELTSELTANPFKPNRVPKESDSYASKNER